MPDSSLGNAVLTLSTDDTKLNKGLDQAQSKAKSFGKAALIAIGGVGLAVAGAGAASIKSAADFEQSISGIKAVSGATGTQIDQISALALKLGKDTVFSASEAADGIQELVKAGVSIPDIMNGGAQSMLNLAAAGGVSVPDAATIAANAMAIFNLHGKDMAHVADLIAGAANASSLDVSDFKLSLGAVGAVAEQSGQSFDSTAQAIAVMGQAGIKGSDAGTSLKTFLLRLQPTTKGATAAMQQLGLITADGTNTFIDAQGHFKSMADISDELQKATTGLTDAQKAQAFQTIFGTDAIRAASVFSKAGAQGFSDMAGAMDKVSAASVANTRLDNVNGSMQQLQGSLETLAITVGTLLLPYVRQAVDALTNFLNAAIPWVEAHGPAFLDTLTKIGTFIQTTLVPAFNQFVTTLQNIWTAAQPVIDFIQANMQPILAGLGAMLAAVVVPAFVAWGVAATAAAIATVIAMAPVLVPVLLIGAAVALLYKAWTSNFLGIQDIVAAVWKFVQPILQSIYDTLAVFWTTIEPLLAQVWQDVQNDVRDALNFILPLIQAALNFLMPYWQMVWSVIQTVLQAVWQVIQIVISTVWAIISDLIIAGLQILTGDWSGAWTTIQDLLNTVWAAMKLLVDVEITAIQTVLNTVLTFIRDKVWTPIWTAIQTFLNNAWTTMSTFVTAQITGIETSLSTTLDGIKKTWNNAWSAIGGFLSDTWDGIRDGLKTTVNTIIGYLDSLISAWNGLHFSLPGFDITIPGIPGVTSDIHWGFGGYDLKTPDISSIPTLDSGGIVTGPLLAALAQNNKPEAVIPLNRAGSLLDEDKLAAKIAAALAQHPRYVLNASYAAPSTDRTLVDDVRLLNLLGSGAA